MRQLTLTILILFISLASFGIVGPITGPTSLCTGGTVTLNDTTAGGIWSSGSTGVAVIGSSSGILTGVSSGVVTITYTAGTFVTITITVNPSPGAILGSSSVCLGSPVTFTCPTPGGSWASSNPAIATINPVTGYLTGVSPGMATILYTVSTGCSTSRIITVNPSPAPISGSTSACVGLSSMLTDVTSGGVWSSSAPGVATISGSGIYTGVSAGAVVISYTMGSGCSSAITVTINPMPLPVTGTYSSVCVGATIALTDGTLGGSWYSSSSFVANVSSSGVVTGVGAGTAIISYSLSTGCTATRTITVNPLPIAYTMTGGGSYCAGGTGVTVSLSASQTGVSYQLFLGASSVGTLVSGTGLALVLEQ